LNKVFMEN